MGRFTVFNIQSVLKATQQAMLASNGVACPVLNYQNNWPSSFITANSIILPALDQYKYSIRDASIIAVGGAAAGATDLRILGTVNSVDIPVTIVPIAGLTAGTMLRLGSAAMPLNASPSTSFSWFDKDTPIQFVKTGAAITGATSFLVSIDFLVSTL